MHDVQAFRYRGTGGCQGGCVGNVFRQLDDKGFIYPLNACQPGNRPQDALRQAGQKEPAHLATAALTRGTGAKPSGTLSTQANATVTVKAIDPKVPSVTVLTDEGKTVSLKIADPKNIEGGKVGDKVDITYTQALRISVK